MDWSYVGGFIDAEGNVYRWRRQHRITIVNTCFSVIEAIRDFVGFGTILKRVFHGGGHFGKKPVYVLVLSRREIAEKLSGHIIVKKGAVERAFGVKLREPEISWSYVAGFFDGEGWIAFYPKYAHLAVANKNVMVLELIQSFLGYGKIYDTGRVQTLYIGNHEHQLDFCYHVLPHSIVKKAELERLRAFIEGKEWWANRKLKNVTRDELEELYWNKKLSIRQIAKIFGVGYNSVWLKLEKLQIPRRSYREAKLVQRDIGSEGR